MKRIKGQVPDPLDNCHKKIEFNDRISICPSDPLCQHAKYLVYYLSFLISVLGFRLISQIAAMWVPLESE